DHAVGDRDVAVRVVDERAATAIRGGVARDRRRIDVHGPGVLDVETATSTVPGVAGDRGAGDRGIGVPDREAAPIVGARRVAGDGRVRDRDAAGAFAAEPGGAAAVVGGVAGEIGVRDRHDAVEAVEVDRAAPCGGGVARDRCVLDGERGVFGLDVDAAAVVAGVVLREDAVGDRDVRGVEDPDRATLAGVAAGERETGDRDVDRR